MYTLSDSIRITITGSALHFLKDEHEQLNNWWHCFLKNSTALNSWFITPFPTAALWWLKWSQLQLQWSPSPSGVTPRDKPKVTCKNQFFYNPKCVIGGDADNILKYFGYLPFLCLRETEERHSAAFLLELLYPKAAQNCTPAWPFFYVSYAKKFGLYV